MPETKTIRYGDAELDLTASDTLVAIPETAQPAAMNELALRGVERDGAQEMMRLGSFRIVSYESSPRGAEEAIRRMNASPAQPMTGPKATKVYHTSEDAVPFVPSGEIYVEFAEDVDDEQATEILIANNLEYIKQSGPRGIVVRTDSTDAVDLCFDLQQMPEISIAEPELLTPGQLCSMPSDALLDQQWHLKNTGQINGSGIALKEGADARVVSAWTMMDNVGDSSVVVAVIDDGYDLGHPDLGPSGRIVAPFDFTRNSTDVSPGLNNPNPGPSFNHDDWHGTACAGVAVGRTDAEGIVGAAPVARLMPIRWGTSLSDTQIENWFGHAKDNGADVVSCSWGAAATVFRLSNRARNAIADCAQNGRNGLGCVICFAAGNSNRDINNFPFSVDGFAIHPDVITVAASTSVDTKANYSNFGDEVSVCAPSSGAGGRGVLTADVRGNYVFNGIQYFKGYAPGDFTVSSSNFVFGGTSSSCPLVAGICALILSIDPSRTAAQVKQLLEATARRIGDPSSYDSNGHSRQFGFGCVDAEAAVEELLASHPHGAEVVASTSTNGRRSRSRRKTREEVAT